MPCKDTSALTTVEFDRQELLVGFDFSKLTCQKTIGGDSGFLEYCRGKNLSVLENQEFSEVAGVLGIAEGEEQFLLFLEWDALRTTIMHYLGKSDLLDADRYQLESIDYCEEGVEIRQVIRPPSEMPKVVSCAVSAKQQNEENLSS